MNSPHSQEGHVFLPFHYYLIGIILGIWGSLYLIPAIILIVIVTYLITWEKSKKIVITVFSLFLISYILCKIHQNFFLNPEKIPLNTYVTVQGQVEKITTYPEFKTYCVLKNVEITHNGKKIKLKNKILWKIYNSPNTPLPGQYVKGRFKLYPLRTYNNPGNSGYIKTYYLQNTFYVQYSYKISNKIKIYGSPYFLWEFKRLVKKKILKCLNGVKNKGFILSLIIGDRNYLTYKDTKIFRQASLSHIIAQSGLHVGFVALIGISLVIFISYIYPDIFLYIPKQKLACFISCALVIFFLCVSEPRPSLIRATVMYLVWCTLFFINHKYAIIDGIALSILILLILNPYCIFDIGLQLSYLSVIIIITFYSSINRKLIKLISNKALLYIISVLIISVIINISILPIISYYFGEVYIACYTNVIFIPVIGLLIFPLIFLASIISFIDYLNFISMLLFSICDKILSLCMKTLIILNKNELLPTIVTIRPNSFMIIGFYIFLFAIYLKINQYNHKVKYLMLLSLIFFLIPFMKNYIYDKQGQVNLKVLDVGRGQGLLIEYKGKRILIDCGGTWYRKFNFGKNVLSPILTYTRFPILDKIILTRNNIYHMGGLFYISKKYKINEFYYNGQIDKKIKYILTILKKRDIKINPIKKHTVIFISNNLQLEILKVANNADNYLIIKLIYKKNPILTVLPKIDKYLLNKYPALNLKSSVIVLPPYTLRNKVLQWIVKNISPTVVILTGGTYSRSKIYLNKYKGFFKKQDIQVYSTQISGCINIIFRKNDKFYFKLKTFLPKRRVVYEQGNTSKIYYFSAIK